MATEFREQMVWPLALRLIHWLLAIAVTVLLLTGWLLGSGLVLNEALYQMLRESLHVPAGQLAGVALLARLLLLLFDPGVGGWRALLVPAARDLAGTGEMLKFYLSFGRRRIPGYYAHDPLWRLVYPFWFLLTGVQVLSGMALEWERPRALLGAGTATWSAWHAAIAGVIFWLVLLHVVSVLLREVRGRGYEVSAMIQGHRIFKVEKADVTGAPQEVKISVEDLLGPSAKGD